MVYNMLSSLLCGGQNANKKFGLSWLSTALNVKTCQLQSHKIRSKAFYWRCNRFIILLFHTQIHTAFMLPKTRGKVDIMKSISQFIVLKCGYYPLLAPRWMQKVHRRCNFGLNFDQGILNRRYIMTV